MFRQHSFSAVVMKLPGSMQAIRDPASSNTPTSNAANLNVHFTFNRLTHDLPISCSRLVIRQSNPAAPSAATAQLRRTSYSLTFAHPQNQDVITTVNRTARDPSEALFEVPCRTA
jgi:hypothetical protein